MISVIIPVHNEEKIVRSQLEKICKLLKKTKTRYEMIAVENGSQDSTWQQLVQLHKTIRQLRIIRCAKADYGLALRTGMKRASGKWIFNFDIDFFNVEFVSQVLALDKFGYDLVVASKNSRLSHDLRGRMRRTISSVYKYYLYYGFGLDVSDTHGIKGWRNDKELKKLINQTKHNGEIFDTEVIVRSHMLGRKHLELPIEVAEMRKSVTRILPRAVKGFIQITDLWLSLKNQN